MTCIVGLVDGNKVYMGGDSASVGGLDSSISNVDKVFKNKGFLMGYTTSWRMGQLLRYALRPPPRDPDDPVEQYMVVQFVNAVRETFRVGGWIHKENEREEGGQFLVGYGGRLFFVQGDYQVNERVGGFDACGCGYAYALGSLHSSKGEAPENRVIMALEAAAFFSAGVRPPFKVLSIETTA